ncbi:nuclease harbi1-like protein [Plakobranchus ocellatus]|uniref:Nuclease harbi1-like protein n=1 Tax=Plakobranchus ocellatus TaxID=259542 RepID=A0AAV3Z6G5_9GAST|nr:nuclease harbi1-like protein [Plakobranchus ocellatus]
MAFRFRLGAETVRCIVKEMLQVIWRRLQPQELPVPDRETSEHIVNGFYERWQFSLCADAIDGKHVQLKAPTNSGSQYFNYKGHHSIVLMATCDARSKFVVIDGGAFGSSSDGGIFQDSNFFQLLRSNKLHLPDPKKISNTNVEVPYVFVGDEAFPLLENLMRPFPRRDLSDDIRIFNYRLSRARKQIECAFGILSRM